MSRLFLARRSCVRRRSIAPCLGSAAVLAPNHQSRTPTFMGKVAIAVVLALALIRAGDNYLFYGKYTDTALFVVRQILQSFGA
jgi:hypothetical protein